MKKVFAWIIGSICVCVLGVYIILFTSLGNNALKPFLQHKIDSLTPIKLEISEFSLRFGTLKLVLTNGEYVRIDVNGNFWLFSQEIDINIQANVFDMSIFGELVDTPLQGSFKLNAQARGSVDNIEINATSDIAKSFSTLYAQIQNFTIQRAKVHMQDAQLKELVAMLGYKPYIDGLLNIHIDAAENLQVGYGNLEVSKGIFNKEAIIKDFEVEMSETSFQSTLALTFDNQKMNHTFAFHSSIGEIHSQGHTALPSLNTHSTYILEISNLIPFSPLVSRAIRGTFKSSGAIQGEIQKTLHIVGSSNVADSQTHYEMALENLALSNVAIHANDMVLEKLLWMLYLPQYAKAALNAEYSYTQKDKKSNIQINAQGKTSENPQIWLKDFGIALPNTPFTFGFSSVLINGKGEGNAEFVASDDIYVSINPLSITTQSLKSPYTLHIKNLSMLHFSSGIKLAGMLDISGNLAFDKTLSLDFATQSLGGHINGVFRDSQINATIDSMQAHKFLTMLGSKPVLNSTFFGDFTYNTLAHRGTLKVSSKDGRLTQSKLSNDIKQFLGIDITQELYNDIQLSAKLDDFMLDSVFSLTSKNTSLSSQKMTLNLNTQRINAPITLQIGNNKANVYLTDSLKNPSLRFEIQNLSIKGNDVLKGLENILKDEKNKRQIQQGGEKLLRNILKP